ncbi:hypothetical protein B9Z55_015799 [Caenorhabditis nigoni]|uniref:RNA polymerase II-associated protein 1 N-terminal domain-containing protein n=1 Tax=Caenorhabditis nigoni TaxID=1611254 RepID=A0A2G5UBR5_9PELO|nr:hypothetical protein B9Z55_015799 [Caenorhabditis nigoni]
MLISTLSRRFASSTVTPGATQKWDIFASVILSRPPIIAPTMTEIEERFQKLQKLEEEEKSLLCNYELKTKQDLKMVARREQLLREGKELSELDEEIGVTNAQKEDDWSKAAADLDQKFNFGASFLAENVKNSAENLKSVDRALERKLVLIVKQKMGGAKNYSTPWILPQMKHREGETLRQAICAFCRKVRCFSWCLHRIGATVTQKLKIESLRPRKTAERCIGELSGSADLNVDISGNAPFGVFTHRYPKPIAQKTGASGAKIFFYTANLTSSASTSSESSFSVNPEDVSDFQWAICAFCRKVRCLHTIGATVTRKGGKMSFRKMSEFSIKRPTASETDDDLQQMQEEWSKMAQKPSVEVHRMKKRTKMAENEQKPAENGPKLTENAENPSGNSNLAPKIDKNGSARFQIDLEDDQTASGVLFPIQERNLNFGDLAGNSNFLENSNFENFEYSKDDGFPEPLDLTAYFKSGRSLDQSGRSFFAMEFDRIHGDLAENLDFLAENLPENAQKSENPDFQAENEQYLKSLAPEKIDNLMAEIKERFNPEVLEFLKNRGAKKAENPPGHAPKISKFKAQRHRKGAEPIQKGAEPKDPSQSTCNMDKPTEKGAEPEGAELPETTTEKGAEPITKNVEEMMNELEVLDEWAGQEDQEKYNRLATDAIQLDLTAKFGRNLAQRQQRNAVKLFDNCKFKLDDAEGPSDPLLELARSQIDEIKRLYLEEHSDGHQVFYEFGKGLNPILDQCWSLIPIRRVLDTVERRQGHVSADDVEICRLSILWTYMLWAERKSAFFAFAEPNDFYIHLSELFLIGPEILADDVIKKATQKLLEEYVLAQAIAGKINIRMSQKLAGLDAFMPFYEQLIKCYEQYSMGDKDFTMAILIGAYLNAPVGER